MASRASVIRGVASVFLTLATLFLLLRFGLELPTAYQYVKTLTTSYWTFVATVSYALAFYIRAVAWRTADEKTAPTAVYLTSLYIGLAVNHLSPVKLGEAVRLLTARAIGSPLKRTTAILVAQRGIDLSILGLFVTAGLLLGQTVWVAALAFGAGLVLLLLVRRFIRTIPVLIGYGLLAWLFEAGAVTCLFLGADVPVAFPVILIAMSAGVLSGIAQFTPGGLGTYELAMGTVLQLSGVPNPYELALMTHLFKYTFAFLAPVYVLLRHFAIVHLLFTQFKKHNTKG
ncbi:lysylphosphatidylglycerol synthase domain-containing protein [Exiguobacterium sp. K1]|uniref:lysylphosphatidylglycerol synthase domain-containing protein n=1 Tax=Exiguobacterium sp. K1 TaxID=2980105 RepID=UPI00299DD7AD|nr:lysylphosphatidylglycerol synthase domain-containing protein [Exiguobacterium sp. K1]MDX1260293.1 flippase-like domain-containing protein [Exiguobacterium sp. K1]